MAETTNTTKPTEKPTEKTTVVKEEKTTSQSPTTGATTKVETKTVTTTAPVDTSAIKTAAKPLEKGALTPREKKIVNITTFGSGVGFVTGLGYAFSKKKGFWAYVGYGLLGSLMFGTVAGLGAKAMLKGDKKDETKKA